MRSRKILGFLAILMGISLVWFLVGSDERTRGLLLTSLQLTGGVVAIAVPGGVAFALVITRTDAPLRNLASTILTAMLLVPVYLQAAGWDAGFGRMGWLSLSGEAYREPWLFGLRGAIWVHASAAIPWVALLVGFALRQVDPDLEEFALLDSSPWSVVWRVTLPTVRGSIVVAGVWVAVLTTAEITVTDLYQVRTLSEEIYTTVQLIDPLSLSEGDSVRLPSGMVPLFLVYAAAVGLAALLAYAPLRTPLRASLSFPLGRWRWPAALALATAVLWIAGVPLLNLVYNAGAAVQEQAGELQRSWSLGKFIRILGSAPPRFAAELGWSALMGAVSATLCLISAVPLAWCGRRSNLGAPLIAVVAALTMAIPGPVLALTMIQLLNRPGIDSLSWLYDHTILAPVLATSLRALPASLLIVWYGLITLPAELLDAAEVDGLAPPAQLVYVVLPIRWPALLAAWLVALVLAAGDLTASILVTPPGLFTVPVRVFGLLHAGVDDQVAGLCLTNLALYAAVIGVLVPLFHRASRHG